MKIKEEKAASVNPFLSMMYTNMSFKVWLKLTQKRGIERVQSEELGAL